MHVCSGYRILMALSPLGPPLWYVSVLLTCSHMTKIKQGFVAFVAVEIWSQLLQFQWEFPPPLPPSPALYFFFFNIYIFIKCQEQETGGICDRQKGRGFSPLFHSPLPVSPPPPATFFLVNCARGERWGWGNKSIPACLEERKKIKGESERGGEEWSGTWTASEMMLLQPSCSDNS